MRQTVNWMLAPPTDLTDSVVRLPVNLTYSLPQDFTSVPINLSEIATTTNTFVGSTIVDDPVISDALARAAKAPFISYSEEFSNLLGEAPEIKLIEDRHGEGFAFEGSIWIPDQNKFWFSSALYNPPLYLSSLDLTTGKVSRLNTTAGYINFQRGIYSPSERLVYCTSLRDNQTYNGGLLAINVDTLEVNTVFNSYMGLQFAGLNDVTAVQAPDSRKYFFISDTDFLSIAYQNIAPAKVFNALYRYDPQRGQLSPVISRLTQNGMNAVKVGPDLKSLIVSDLGPAPAVSTIPSTQTIFKYDLDEHMRPINQRLLATPRFFIDALHVDDKGRVWSAEGDGIVVRSSEGELLGVFNKMYFGRDTQFANVGLAGDTIVVLAVDRLWTVKLTEPVVTANSRHVFA